MAEEAQLRSFNCLKSFGTRPLPEHRVLQGELLEVSISCRDFRRQSSSEKQESTRLKSNKRRLGWRIRSVFRQTPSGTENRSGNTASTITAESNHSHKKLPLPPLNMQDLSDHTASCSSFGSDESYNDLPWDVPVRSDDVSLDVIIADDSEEIVHA